MKNWKTIVAGVAVVGAAVAQSMGWLSSDIISWVMQGLIVTGIVHNSATSQK